MLYSWCMNVIFVYVNDFRKDSALVWLVVATLNMARSAKVPWIHGSSSSMSYRMGTEATKSFLPWWMWLLSYFLCCWCLWSCGQFLTGSIRCARFDKPLGSQTKLSLTCFMKAINCSQDHHSNGVFLRNEASRHNISTVINSTYLAIHGLNETVDQIPVYYARLTTHRFALK